MVKPPEKVIFVLFLYPLYAVYQPLTTYEKLQPANSTFVYIAEKQISGFYGAVASFTSSERLRNIMMNRDRVSRGRSSMSNRTTTFGLDERVERTLLYPISAVAGLFWPLGWLVGLVVALFEKNRNVRAHALQSSVIFGVLSIVLAIVKVLAFLLGKVFFIGFFFSVVLGGLVAWILFWLIVALAVWLTVMVWFRPNYRLPFVGRWIDNLFMRWQ